MSIDYLVVLLPFHRYDQYLLDAVESCLKALPNNSRIVAINTLNDSKMLSSYSRSVYEVNHPQADYMTALKFGLSKCQSEYVAIMNGDDLVDELRFIKQIEALQDSRYNLCVSDIYKFTQKKGSKFREVPSLLGKPPEFFNEALLLIGSYRADATWCFKRKWSEENMAFNLEIDASDWCVGMRIMKRTDTIVLNEKLYLYRMHSEQVTRNQNLSNSKHFYVNWIELNQRMNFRDLTINEIEMLTSPNKSQRIGNLDNILLWLDEVGKFLKEHANEISHKQIDNILSRRRLMICFKNRSPQLIFRDFFIIPKVLVEYLRNKKFLRGSL